LRWARRGSYAGIILHCTSTRTVSMADVPDNVRSIVSRVSSMWQCESTPYIIEVEIFPRRCGTSFISGGPLEIEETRHSGCRAVLHEAARLHHLGGSGTAPPHLVHVVAMLTTLQNCASLSRIVALGA
jgi:hypothetical protein